MRRALFPHILLLLTILIAVGAGARGDSNAPSAGSAQAIDPSLGSTPILVDKNANIALDPRTFPPTSNPPPALVVKLENDKPSESLPLSKLDVGVIITGYLSQTTLTMTFCNTHNRALEGQLYFPLPEGATITGYALDIHGNMVDGVVVPKDEGRITFEKEERRGVDPGLLEWVKGNNFRTRVYPIPANGCRTVRVQYVSDLQTISAAPGSSHSQALYRLPLHFDKPIDSIHVKLQAVGGDVAPRVSGGILGRSGQGGASNGTTAGGGATAGDTAGATNEATHSLEFEKLNDRYTAEVTLQNAQPRDDLLISLPDIARQQATVENDPAGKSYFVLNDTPAVTGASTVQQPPVARIGVAWDASMSRKTEDKTREIKLLGSLLERLKNVDVDVMLFRNSIDNPPQDKAMFSVKDGDASAVLTFLKKVDYDGGTDLGRLHFYRSPRSFHPSPAPSIAAPADSTVSVTQSTRPVEDYSYWLLFTDGLGNLGDAMPQAMERPVYAISSASGADHSLLHAIGQKSGGSYFNLQRTGDEDVLSSVGKPVYSFLGATFDKGAITDIYPKGQQEVHGRFTLSGRLLAGEATITLNYGWGDRVTGQSTYTLKRADATNTGLAPHFWAERKVDELELTPAKNKDSLLALARQFNLVTPGTSLLVLETLDQYVQYHIQPPTSLPEMVTQYQKAITGATALEKISESARIKQVVKLWNDEVAWWNTRFTYPANFKYVEKATKPNAEPPAEPALMASSAGSTTGGGVRRHGEVFGRRRANGDTALRQRLPMTGASADEAMVEPRSTSAHALSSPPSATAAATPTALPAGRVSGAAGASGGAAYDFENRRNSTDLSYGAGSGNAQFMDGHARSSESLGLATTTPAQAQDAAGADISIKPWDPQTPYMTAIKGAGAGGAYAAYLKQQDKYGASPAFYLDVADYLFKVKQHDLAVRVLTNIAEMELENPQLLRVLAHKLEQEEELDLSIDVFEKVLALRPEEPQSHRDLALALADRAAYKFSFDKSSALADDHRAQGLLNDVVVGTWDDRFPEIETIALLELDHLNSKVQALEGGKAQSYPSDPRLAKLLDVDVRIALTWDTDETDMDLWVTEPSGEKCFYAHNRTTIGGAISRDFTQGYGPEVYMVHHAMPGVYKIQANYYGSHQQTLSGPSTLQVTLITNYGRPNEKRQSLTVRLVENKEVIDIGSVKVGG